MSFRFVQSIRLTLNDQNIYAIFGNQKVVRSVLAYIDIHVDDLNVEMTE